MEKFEIYLDKGVELLIAYLPKLGLALATLFLGFKIIKFAVSLAEKAFEKRNVDPTLRPILLSLLTWIAKIMLVISACSMVGIETTSFIAMLGAMGLAVGLSLQGALSNFAGGILLLLFRPYKVGDIVVLGDVSGYVMEIKLFTTIIKQWNRSEAIIPNGAIANGKIINYNTFDHRRIEVVVRISYDSDIKKAKQVLMEMLESNPAVLKKPGPTIYVSELAENAVILKIWAYGDNRNDDIWTIFFNLHEEVKLILEKHNIKIAYPQMDVHLDKQDEQLVHLGA